MNTDSVYSLDRLIRIALDLSAEKDFDMLMQKILLEAMEICHCDAGTVYVKEDDHLNFHTVYTKSKGIPAADQSRNADLPPVPLRRTHVCACAAMDNKKINIPDIYSSADYDFTGAQKYDAINKYRTGSMLVIPMNDEKDNIIGVLQLINAQDDNGSMIPFDKSYEEIVSALASLAAVSLNNHKLAQEVIDLLHSFVWVMVDAIEARSSYNATHTRSMVRYAERFMAWLDKTGSGSPIPEEAKDAFIMSIWLHDIGKLVIPLEVLDKPDRLSSSYSIVKNRIEIACLSERLRSYEDPSNTEEHRKKEETLKKAWALIDKANTAPYLDDDTVSELKEYSALSCLTADGREIRLLDDKELDAITVRKGTLTSEERKLVEDHVSYTARMLSQMNFKGVYEHVPVWAGNHHEYIDGSGYPEGLKGDALPFESRLITIIDIYDALTAEDRPYKPPMSPEKAFSVLESMRDEGKLDGEILAMFRESGVWEKD